MLPTKIVIIGAGSAIFGLNTLGALMRSPRLRGSHLSLVDRHPEALGLIERLANRLNREWKAEMVISAHTHHRQALSGAEFIVSAIEVPPREVLWRSDYEIPLKYGVRQPYAENGGPGGFAHACRNIPAVLEIAYDMQQACPAAWFINFTNPMVRICDAISRYTSIKVVGLCHQIYTGYGMVGYALARELDIPIPPGKLSTHADPETLPRFKRLIRPTLERVDLRAAGLNHFSWMLALHDRRSGEDLYPSFAKAWQALDPSFEPLTRRIYEIFGLFPISGDEHLCEYLPWMSDPRTQPWQKYDLSLYDWDRWAQQRRDGHALIAAMASGAESLDSLLGADSEGALEVIENIAGGGNHYHPAINLPNRGYITNLPEGAIVEVPGIVSGAGVNGVAIGSLPETIAELMRREIAVSRLAVTAAVQGDRRAALQCLLLDPVITDLDTAQKILDDYLEVYRDHLPQFWN